MIAFALQLPEYSLTGKKKLIITTEGPSWVHKHLTKYYPPKNTSPIKCRKHSYCIPVCNALKRSEISIWKACNDVVFNKKVLSSPVALVYKSLMLTKTWRPLLKPKLKPLVEDMFSLLSANAAMAWPVRKRCFGSLFTLGCSVWTLFSLSWSFCLAWVRGLVQYVWVLLKLYVLSCKLVAPVPDRGCWLRFLRKLGGCLWSNKWLQITPK